MQAGRHGPTIAYTDAHEQVVRRGLGIFNRYVEVSAVIEYPGIEQFELALGPAASAILLDKLGIREGNVRVLEEHLHIGMGRHAIAVEVQLLDVLAMVALAVGRAEEAALSGWGRGRSHPRRLSIADQSVASAACQGNSP